MIDVRLSTSVLWLVSAIGMFVAVMLDGTPLAILCAVGFWFGCWMEDKLENGE